MERKILVVSDATGSTAEHVLRAALAQFEANDVLTFAVKHDDGMGLEDLNRADVILVGVSRTSKTPLSIYLAVRGYLVANIPILLNVDPPPELFKADQRKVVGLRMDPFRLRQIREQ